MSAPVTYSFKDLSGAFAHPLVGAFQFAGQIGMGQITIAMSTEKTTHQKAADGLVQITYVAGDNAQITIECLQTSDFHKFLLDWYNAIKALADNGDVSQVATAAITMRNLVDGSGHVARGVSPNKIPDKTYAEQGGNVAWVLMCADLQNL